MDEMLAVMDFAPAYCPSYGKKWSWDNYQYKDWIAGEGIRVIVVCNFNMSRPRKYIILQGLDPLGSSYAPTICQIPV